MFARFIECLVFSGFLECSPVFQWVLEVSRLSRVFSGARFLKFSQVASLVSSFSRFLEFYRVF